MRTGLPLRHERKRRKSAMTNDPQQPWKIFHDSLRLLGVPDEVETELTKKFFESGQKTAEIGGPFTVTIGRDSTLGNSISPIERISPSTMEVLTNGEKMMEGTMKPYFNKAALSFTFIEGGEIGIATFKASTPDNTKYQQPEDEYHLPVSWREAD